MPLAALTLLLAAAPAGAAGGGPRDVLATAASAAALPPGARLQTELGPGLRAYLVRVPAGRSAASFARSLERSPDVFAAQPNSVLRTTGFATTCAEAPTDQSEFLATALKATSAVRDTDAIAILDTGVSENVPEFGTRVRPGYNAAAGTEDTSDTDGHGTEVAAAAAAAASSGLVGGVSPRSPILPITIYNSAGISTVAWVVKGITEAYTRGAGIINLSGSAFVDETSASDVRVFAQAVATAFNRGVITIGAVGNENRGDPVIPGSLPRVITVGSAATTGTRDAFSNYGPWLDLVAPGADLVLPAPPDVCTSGYGQVSGTSFAAPAVAGGAALLQAAHPKFSTTQLFDLIRMRSAVAFSVTPTGRDDNSGFGMMDVAAGVSGSAFTSEPREVDDDVYWLKQDPKGHPKYLSKGRSARISGAVSPGKDPQDVVPVVLKRGETLTASVGVRGDNALVEATIWSPSTGQFDIGKGSTNGFLADSGGFSGSPQARYRARRSGTYYVAVAGPDLSSEKDTEVNRVTIAPRMLYTLTLKKTKAAPVKKKTTKKK